MITYKDVFEAYTAWFSEKSVAAWCTLWALVDERMRTLCLYRIRRMQANGASVDKDCIADIIEDSVINVMQGMREKDISRENDIAKLFWNANRKAFLYFTRRMHKIAKERVLKSF